MDIFFPSIVLAAGPSGTVDVLTIWFNGRNAIHFGLLLDNGSVIHELLALPASFTVRLYQ